MPSMPRGEFAVDEHTVNLQVSLDRSEIQFLARLLFIGVAGFVGWIVYMVAMVLTAYDGMFSLLFQPIMGVIFSSLVTLAAVIVGLLLRIPLLRQAWNYRTVAPTFLLCASLFVMCSGPFLGWTVTYPGTTGEPPVTTLAPRLGLASYFALLFAIANWPLDSMERIYRRLSILVRRHLLRPAPVERILGSLD